MMFSSNSSLFPPQLLEDLLDVLQGLLHCGQAPAAARLTFAAFPSSIPLPQNHVCPLSFPPPPTLSSRRHRRRRQRRRTSSVRASRSDSAQLSSSEAINGESTLQQFHEFDVKHMSATIDRLAPENRYLPFNSASTPTFDGPATHSKEERVVTMEEEVKMMTTEGDEIRTLEKKVVDCPKPLICDDSHLQLAQPQGGLVSGTLPAPSPAYQPIASLSKPLAVEDVEDVDCMDIGVALKEEEIGIQTASQVGEPIVSKKVEEPIGNKEVKEPVVVNQDMEMTNAKQQAEEEVSAKQDEEEVVVTHAEDKVSFSIEDLEYEDTTGRLLIHLEDGVVEVNNLQVRDQLLAKMSSVPDDVQLLANMFPSPGARVAPTLFQVPDVVEVEDVPHVSPKHVNFRLQEQRLTHGHLGQGKAKSLGRWTSWTRDLLLSDLAAAFNRPKRGISWSDFSLEEKLGCFDMVDWAETYPLDPPPRTLMFQPEEDQWSTWA